MKDKLNITVDHVIAEHAKLYAKKHQTSDIEDAILYYTALKFEMDYFISADRKLKKSATPQLSWENMIIRKMLKGKMV